MSNIHKEAEDQAVKVNTEAGKGPLQNNDQTLKKAPFSKDKAPNKGLEVKKVTVKK